MCQRIKKLFIGKLLIGLSISGFFILSAPSTLAFTITDIAPNAIPVAISGISLSSDSFDPTSQETVSIKYCLNTTAKVNLGIYLPSGSSSKEVNILTLDQTKNAGCYSTIWNGSYDSASDLGSSGDIVNDGQYFYYLQADGVSPTSSGTDSSSNWIHAGQGPNPNTLKIVDVQVDNPTFDPWDSQKAQMHFTLSQNGYVTLAIYDQDSVLVNTLVDNKWYQKGDYTVYWNGQDNLGTIVDQAKYSYSLKVKTDTSTDKKTGSLEVKKGYTSNVDQTEDPRIQDFYATKASFDPGRKEKEFIVFTLTAKADMSVIIYDKDSNKVSTLVDKPDQPAGTYKFQWDGSEVLGKTDTYTYRIYVKNSKGEEFKNGTINVAEDRSDKSTPNIFKDSVDTIPYSPKGASLGINFTMEKDGTVTVEIRDAKHLVRTVSTNVPLPMGTHTVYWDGKDNYGNIADDGLYLYRITAKNSMGKETEDGNFSVQGSTQAKYNSDFCAQFTDVSTDNQYCAAIEWVIGQGVFTGFNDGTFRPDKSITRAEALKVIALGLKVKLISANGQDLGFNDTVKSKWYADYIKTGLSLGIIHGYNDGSFKPEATVNRVDGLVMLLNTGKAKDNIIIPTNISGLPYSDTPSNSDTKWYISYAWYAKANSLTSSNTYFYPSADMTRGEMADMLYRYHNANLAKN